MKILLSKEFRKKFPLAPKRVVEKVYMVTEHLRRSNGFDQLRKKSKAIKLGNEDPIIYVFRVEEYRVFYSLERDLEGEYNLVFLDLATRDEAYQAWKEEITS